MPWALGVAAALCAALPLFAIGLPHLDIRGSERLHVLIEPAAIASSLLAFAACWSAVHELRPGHLALVAATFLVVAALISLRLLSYPGMPVLGSPDGLAKVFAFTLAAKALIALAMLAVVCAPERWPIAAGGRALMLAAAIAVASALGAAILLAPAALPHGLVAPGEAGFRAAAAAFLAEHLLAAAVLLVRYRGGYALPVKLLVAINLLFAASAAALAFLARALDAAVALAQLYEIAGAFLIYRAIAICFIRLPYLRQADAERRNRELAALAVASEERFRNFAQSASDWFWETGPDHRYTYGSHRAGKFNYDPGSFIGRYRWDLAADAAEDPEKWRAHRALLDRHEPFREFVYRVEPPGLQLYISASGQPIFDAAGRFRGYRGATRDVTEEVRMAAALRLSESRFRAFAETASDWFWETGPDHSFTFISEDAERAGIDIRARLGRSRFDAARRSAEDAAHWREHLTKLQNHEPFRDFVYEIERRDGTKRLVSVSGKPFFGEKGEFAGYRGGVRDVTEIVLAERALREAKAAAEKANRAKSDFLANMSHELRTPLNAIIGFSEIMKAGVLGKSEERYRDYAANIFSSGQHLLAIVNDLLDVARIEAGRVKLADDIVRLEDLFGESARMVEAQIAAAGLSLTIAVPDRIPSVRADRLALRQIIVNLLSNAAKFTPAGGRVTLAAAREPTGEMLLSVSDTGIGIDAEDIPRLMQPFSQVAGVYSRKHQGTGLGLMLVRSLTELHGGTVTLESRKGEGTRVSVRLPRERVLLNGAWPAVEPVG